GGSRRRRKASCTWASARLAAPRGHRRVSGEEAPHRGARPHFETQGALAFADGAKASCLLACREGAEAEPLVVGGVPRHVEVGGERERAEGAGDRPGGRVLDQCPAEALPHVVGADAHLLYVLGAA